MGNKNNSIETKRNKALKVMLKNTISTIFFTISYILPNTHNKQKATIYKKHSLSLALIIVFQIRPNFMYTLIIIKRSWFYRHAIMYIINEIITWVCQTLANEKICPKLLPFKSFPILFPV